MKKIITAWTAIVFSGLASAPAALSAEAWQQAIATGLGKQGTEMPGGVYRVGLPRTDLRVVLDGVELKPALALGSWLAFTKHDDDQVMVMGDLVLTDDEVNAVMERLIDGGIEITALHNHLLRNTPHTMYMHVGGHGEPGALASTLREALGRSKTPFATETGTASQSPAGSADSQKTLELDTAVIDRAIGRAGKVNGGVYQISVRRADPPREGGMEIPEAMGSAIAINFQPTGKGKVAITGDFVLTADEVNPVIRALRANGIEVAALHNHMLDDEPRLFFMHFWAVGDAQKLANGLAATISKVKVAKS